MNDLIPEIGTTATINDEKEVCATEVFTLTDTVEYKHLVPGKEYTLKGILMDKATGEPFLQNGEQITSEVTFVPEAPSGSVEVLFTSTPSSSRRIRASSCSRASTATAKS